MKRRIAKNSNTEKHGAALAELGFEVEDKGDHFEVECDFLIDGQEIDCTSDEAKAELALKCVETKTLLSYRNTFINAKGQKLRGSSGCGAFQPYSFLITSASGGKKDGLSILKALLAQKQAEEN